MIKTISFTLIYIFLLCSLTIMFDYTIEGWVWLLIIVVWYVLLSQFLHIINGRARAVIQEYLSGILESDSKSFTDYRDVVSVKVGEFKCDALIGIAEGNLKLKFKNKYSIYGANIKQIESMKIGNVMYSKLYVVSNDLKNSEEIYIEKSAKLSMKDELKLTINDS